MYVTPDGMTDVDDENLARRAAAGDRTAFSVLLERHYGLIYRVAARMLGDRAAAEDLAQDVCVGLVTRLASYGGQSRFTTWLYRVVVNAARDAMRRDAHPPSKRAGFRRAGAAADVARAAAEVRNPFGCNRCWAS